MSVDLVAKCQSFACVSQHYLICLSNLSFLLKKKPVLLQLMMGGLNGRRA